MGNEITYNKHTFKANQLYREQISGAPVENRFWYYTGNALYYWIFERWLEADTYKVKLIATYDPDGTPYESVIDMPAPTIQGSMFASNPLEFLLHTGCAYVQPKESIVVSFTLTPKDPNKRIEGDEDGNGWHSIP